MSKASAGVMEVMEVFGYSNLKDMIKVWKLITPLHLTVFTCVACRGQLKYTVVV